MIPKWDEKNVKSIVDFWRRQAGKGTSDDILKRDEVLQDDIADLVQRFPRTKWILDVGAGPVSTLGWRHPDFRVQVFATDELASEYGKLSAELNLAPHTVTQYAQAEALSEVFPETLFHLVHCRNGIEHFHDPLKALTEMVKMLIEGGYLYLRNYPNEGRKSNWNEMHQWDVDLVDGELFLWDKDLKKTDLNQHLETLGMVPWSLTRQNREIVSIFIKESGDDVVGGHCG